MRARLLLSTASEIASISESDAIDMLHNAVVTINSLPKTTSGSESAGQSSADLAMSELNDPRSFTDSPEVQRAFSSVARVDFDGTLLAAGRINPASVQLMARLATAETALAKRTRRTRARRRRTLLLTGAPKRAT